MFVLTVSQLNRYVKAVLEEDKKLADIYLKGEISNFKHHFRSGHFYFSIKDEASSVRAVMFKSYASELRFTPQDGMAVLVRAGVGVYERDGAYQLYVTDIQPDGVGALSVAMRQLKEKLMLEGLFDDRHKKPLPPYPAAIGVITSRTGAVLGDITHVLSRRYPVAKLIFCPALVQGAEASASMIGALKALDGRCDVIILGRGGGSDEDLSCFNDEGLARAVFAAVTPVISAVGHEGDHTICDLVADLRAPTPSAAAELATPSAKEILGGLDFLRGRLTLLARRIIINKRERLSAVKKSPALRSPLYQIKKKRERLDFLREMLYTNKRMYIRRLSQDISLRSARLDALSPLAVLGRGYSMTLREDKPVLSVREIMAGEKLITLLSGGGFSCTVDEIFRED